MNKSKIKRTHTEDYHNRKKQLHVQVDLLKIQRQKDAEVKKLLEEILL